MKRKRLQHAADTLCHMFCGWRLLFSYPKLEALGSGNIEIDALTLECRFNGQPIELSITDELHAWLVKDLEANGLTLTDIRVARLRARLVLTPIHQKDRRKADTYLDPGERPVQQDEYVACEISCASEVATDEKSYSSQFEDREEWPRGWRAGAA